MMLNSLIFIQETEQLLLLLLQHQLRAAGPAPRQENHQLQLHQSQQLHLLSESDQDPEEELGQADRAGGHPVGRGERGERGEARARGEEGEDGEAREAESSQVSKLSRSAAGEERLSVVNIGDLEILRRVCVDNIELSGATDRCRPGRWRRGG